MKGYSSVWLLVEHNTVACVLAWLSLMLVFSSRYPGVCCWHSAARCRWPQLVIFCFSGLRTNMVRHNTPRAGEVIPPARGVRPLPYFANTTSLQAPAEPEKPTAQSTAQ